MEELSKKYTVIIFTAKAKPDRGLVNGKTGTELVWEWLKKYDMAKFVSKVTSEKPRAVAYIDDKAVEFRNWDNALRLVERLVDSNLTSDEYCLKHGIDPYLQTR